MQKGTQCMKYEDILTWWKKEKKDTKEDIYTLLDNFKILFAYHSGKIENETIILHDTREIFENGSVINSMLRETESVPHRRMLRKNLQNYLTR